MIMAQKFFGLRPLCIKGKTKKGSKALVSEQGRKT